MGAGLLGEQERERERALVRKGAAGVLPLLVRRDTGITTWEGEKIYFFLVIKNVNPF